MTKAPVDLAASAHARLLRRAKDQGRPFNELLQYYAMERFLYRLSRSPESERFVLKGALMLPFWGGSLSRATRDIDLLACPEGSVEEFVGIVHACLSADLGGDDGMRFDPVNVSGEQIREGATYHGVRLRLSGALGNARVWLQVDIGFGDAVVPGPVPVSYPSLLGRPEARLLAYTPESAIAEKYEAMVSLDLANSRMKDLYDVWLLARTRTFDGARLCDAARATFHRRRTPVPESPPVALTSRFASDPDKQTQWRAFIRKTRLADAPPDLADVVQVLEAFLWPPTLALTGRAPLGTWPAGGPWATRDRPDGDGPAEPRDVDGPT